MSRSTFLTYEKPLLNCMVQADNPERIKELMRLSIPEGAEAFGMQFCRMKPEYRTSDTYKELFECAEGRPVYVTNYRYGFNENKSDEELATGLLELAECGATLCDVMGDIFDKQDDELAHDPVAIERQKKLIDELHKRGAEVLMSSHVFKFTPAERVLEIAFEQLKRGADIVKIVTGADNMDQQIENLRIIDLLKKELKAPFLFLSGGECRISRRIGGAMGNCMNLCVYEYDSLATPSQPLLGDMRKIRELI